jgi:c-di-GMP-binding flagellar brake protein YcgR
MITMTPLELEQVFVAGQTLTLVLSEDDAPLPSLVEEVETDRLWVAMPLQAGSYLPLPTGVALTVRLLSPQGLFVLPAVVRGCRLQPAPMLELEPTGPIECIQRRRHARLQLILMPNRATVIAPDGSETRLPASIVNLSSGGALVRTRQPLAIGQHLHLIVELPPPGGSVDVVGEILRVTVQRAERGRYYDASLRFVALTDHDRDCITKFIFHVQARQARQQTGDLA